MRILRLDHNGGDYQPAGNLLGRAFAVVIVSSHRL